jgi:hypothetical protein
MIVSNAIQYQLTSLILETLMKLGIPKYIVLGALLLI